jgi:phospholipid/cholesterol/gamma-HCH transport system substrate-binding protein
MRRRGSASIVANPVLVGAVTVLVVVVAVFLAYNANNGLPFVPTTQIKVQLANGSNLVKGNEVREGGYRIGVVSDIQPIALNGKSTAVGTEKQVDQPTVGAQITLKLDKKVGKIPADSSIVVRPRSALGLKYLQFTRGHSTTKYLSDGATIPITQTQVPVQIDDVFKIFDRPTRIASQQSLTGFGNALATRGPDLNQTIQAAPSFFGHLAPVMANLADNRTQLARFFQSLNRFTGAIAPVAGVNAQLFTDMATTFAAFSQDPNALKATIEKSPPTLDVSTRSLHDQLPFLRDSAAFGKDLNVAAGELRRALPVINPALKTGIPVLKRSPELNNDLRGALVALRNLAQSPTTNLALRGLTATVGTLNPTLRYLGPYVTVCNHFNYFWTFVAEQFSESDPSGNTQRALIQFANHQTNSVGDSTAKLPANGEGVPPNEEPEYLHAQPYAAAVDSNGNADCEGVQRGYPARLARNAPPNYFISQNPHTPGDQGPVFKSYDDRNQPPSQRQLDSNHVPPGETFTRDPGGLSPVPPQ